MRKRFAQVGLCGVIRPAVNISPCSTATLHNGQNSIYSSIIAGRGCSSSTSAPIMGCSALAAHRFGESGTRIVCVEASPKAARILRANLDANDVRNVSVRNVAMGAIDGSLEMLSTGPAGSDYFVSVPAGRSDTVTVRQLTMSTVLSETGLLPTHVKMDVEGFEDDVIAGALSALKKHHPILFLELHGSYLRARRRDPALVISRLRECGYERIEEAGAEVTDYVIARRNFECRLVCLEKRAN